MEERMIELKDVTKEYSKGIAALNGISSDD